jgi:type IV pilus assembly protein PilC
MKTFRYVARNEEGQRTAGTIQAVDRSHAVAQLRARKLIVTSLAEESYVPARLQPFGSRFSGRDLAIFTGQLASLLAGGLTVLKALEILAEDVAQPALRLVLPRLRYAVEGGWPLSAAMRAYPRLFPPLYVNLVEAGEAAGDLVDSLRRLAGYIESVEAVRRRVIGLLLYPAMVVLFSLTLVMGIVVFVLPHFQRVYQSLGGNLPGPTALLLGLSGWCAGWWPLLLALVLAAFYGGRWLVRQPALGRWLQGALLGLPLVGSLLARMVWVRLARTLAVLYQSGVPILNALEMAARASGNVVYEVALLRCREAVSGGQPLAAALRSTRLFPAVMLSMVDVGEKSGQLAAMLNQVADFYQSEVSTEVEQIGALLEPLLVLWVGIMVGGLVIVLFLPIMNLQQLLR